MWTALLAVPVLGPTFFLTIRPAIDLPTLDEAERQTGNKGYNLRRPVKKRFVGALFADWISDDWQNLRSSLKGWPRSRCRAKPEPIGPPDCDLPCATARICDS